MQNPRSSMDISFFIPCYNEQGNIRQTIENVIQAVKGQGRPLQYEILIVDDCSTDDTVSEVRKVQKEHPEWPIVLQQKEVNQGLGSNYFDASFVARGKYYMMISGDNAEPVDTIHGIVGAMGKADIIIPYFAEKDARSLLRRAISFTFVRLVNLASGTRVKYYNGSVLHLTENVRTWRTKTSGYGYQVELLCRLIRQGKTYHEVHVRNTTRVEGISRAFYPRNVGYVCHSVYKVWRGRFEKFPDPAAMDLPRPNLKQMRG